MRKEITHLKNLANTASQNPEKTLFLLMPDMPV
jgi:hypothetical protein